MCSASTTVNFYFLQSKIIYLTDLEPHLDRQISYLTWGQVEEKRKKSFLEWKNKKKKWNNNEARSCTKNSLCELRLNEDCEIRLWIVVFYQIKQLLRQCTM
jgi:hypothetical protein